MQRTAPLAERPAPLFVVSDIDGTFLNSKERVSPRLRNVVANMKRQGTVFSLATGRPARWLLPVLEQLVVKPLCVCANGAVIYDSARDKIIRAVELQPAVLTDTVARLASDVTANQEEPALEGVTFGVERVGTSAFDRADELFCVTRSYDHAWLSEEHKEMSLEELVAQPAVKLLVRNPRVCSQELYEAVAPRLNSQHVNVTFSWDGGLVEISAPGVSKQSALQWIAEQMGVTGEDAVAFGDMPNDLEMLTWAGVGVAMGNAHDDVKNAADIITGDNDNDGVAEILETWFL
ncbi:HAD family hydrolase [Corynebacterium anserum]|uniref:Cof-type HAD-IIB family hydrolase n=1 Tax=Corynebacterium anserum TaxID=2684406 RepID=A0A7G7YLL9_9CORY|nr:HAD family hydrolase [Corynebacterium anserum]MBC2681453.1 Cof-type HAD-IIB family hydrolase [Corynebacterium anserum]QNH95389.1 Cof-type HAD-IIB family hydrolase [Corynebacterium anserum]